MDGGKEKREQIVRHKWSKSALAVGFGGLWFCVKNVWEIVKKRSEDEDINDAIQMNGGLRRETT